MPRIAERWGQILVRPQVISQIGSEIANITRYIAWAWINIYNEGFRVPVMEEEDGGESAGSEGGGKRRRRRSQRPESGSQLRLGIPYPPHAEIASALQEPFPKELHERHYTGATYVSWPWYQQRLDDVVGPTNWWSEFVEERDDDGKLRRVEYTVWIRFPGDGEEVARTGFWELDTKEKWDIAHSKAFRRACVGHGIGRYLYDSSDFKSDDEMPEGYSGPAARR